LEFIRFRSTLMPPNAEPSRERIHLDSSSLWDGCGSAWVSTKLDYSRHLRATVRSLRQRHFDTDPAALGARPAPVCAAIPR